MCIGGAPGAGAGAVPAPPDPWPWPWDDGPEVANDEAGDGGVEVIVVTPCGLSVC